MLVPNWQKAVVENVIHETHNTRRYFLRLPETERFLFKAGQFVTLDLPIHEKPGRRWRSYSIASNPDGSNLIELLIVLFEGGPGSTYIFNQLKEGSVVMLRGPQGSFFLPDDINKDLFLICTGTGIAPFRSMLLDVLKRKIKYQNIYLIFGTRTKADLLYFEEMKNLEKQLPNFKYLPTLSRERWEGFTGYVHPIYERICESNSNGYTNTDFTKNSCFFICGWKFMILDAREKIKAMGFNNSAIRFELYG